MSVVARAQLAEPRTTASTGETEALGAALAPGLGVGDVLALHGPLGSGKTRLVAGLARGLGAAARVRSPSFTLVHEYAGRVPLLHLDLYRLERPAVDGLGLEELVSRGVVVVEWAERLPEVWLEEALVIEIESGPGDVRRLRAGARAGRGLELLAAWRALPPAESGA